MPSTSPVSPLCETYALFSCYPARQQDTNYTLGIIEQPMALQHSSDLTLASMKNRAGNVVEASVQTMRAALTNVSDTVSGEFYGSFFHQSHLLM